jgi:hypothetical protein
MREYTCQHCDKRVIGDNPVDLCRVCQSLMMSLVGGEERRPGVNQSMPPTAHMRWGTVSWAYLRARKPDNGACGTHRRAALPRPGGTPTTNPQAA